MPLFKKRPPLIAHGVTIRGEITSNSSIVIEGDVVGSVVVENGQLTIGQGGQVTARLTAPIVQVEGVVVGDVVGTRVVVVTGTGRVQGDLISPRVVLEPGATVNGGIDMMASEANGSQEADEG